MNIRRALLAMSLVAAVACLPLSGATGAILTPIAGTVAVNGQPIAAGSAIVPGDLVSTNAESSVRMVLPGGSLIAASRTAFRMESRSDASEVRLERGLVQVAGLLSVALATRTVVPATRQTRFNVYELAGEAYVETLAGSVAVSSAHDSSTVLSGRAVRFSDAPPAKANRSACGGVQAPGGAKPACVAPAVVITSAAVAAVAAGIAVHEFTKCKNCVTTLSPTTP
ncbi:MAG: hypothetical protein ACRD1Y_00795 [Terriglobales bacterium]